MSMSGAVLGAMSLCVTLSNVDVLGPFRVRNSSDRVFVRVRLPVRVRVCP